MTTRLSKAIILGLLGTVFAVALTACGSDEPTATPEPVATPTPTATATPEPGVTPPPTPTPLPTATPRAAWEIEWDELVAAAQAEGEISTFGFSNELMDGLLAPFGEQFGLKIINSDGSGRQQAERTLAEREAGKYTLDVWIGGTGTPTRSLIPAGALAPIKPLLFLPEVLDEAAWLDVGIGGGIIMLDVGRQYILAYAGSADQDSITYNTNLVQGDEITSFWDLLDPRWVGKIVANDPRAGGATAHTNFYYMHPDLGPDFLTRLLTETDIVFAPDSRTAAEWLASGLYSLCLWSCSNEVQAAREDGLPVSEVWPTTLMEGGDIRIGSGAYTVMDTPPNPNAQKLFSNWFLSKEGQSAYQRATENNSLRTDIPKDDVPEKDHLDPGTEYMFFSLDPDASEKAKAAFELVGEVLAAAGR